MAIKSVKCVAHSSQTGNPCGRYAVLGATVCPSHGGSITRVREAARRRVEELIPNALQTLVELLDSVDNPNVRLRAAIDLLDRAGMKRAAEVAVIHQDETNANLDALIAAWLDATGLDETDAVAGED